jgi:WD40 repeat protein
LQHAGPVRRVAFRADGAQLITSSDDNTARVWDAHTGKPLLHPLRHYGSVNQACFCGDGKRLATASADNTGRVWDAETGEPITGPLSHRRWGVITDVACNPTGDRVATASADGTAEIWPLQWIDSPASDIEDLAQLLSGNRIDADRANLSPLEVAELRKLWDGLRSRHSELIGPKP